MEEGTMRNYQNQNSTTVNGGIGFTGLLAIVFIVLKLTGIITWSWLWVLAPIWIGIAIWIIIIAIIAICIFKK
jgi:hypothetical protein